MLADSPVTKKHTRWWIGRGKLIFWHDCWMGNEPLVNLFPSFHSSMTQVCYYFDNNEWDVDKLKHVLPDEVIADILKIPSDTSSDDIAYWVPTFDGNYTT